MVAAMATAPTKPKHPVAAMLRRAADAWRPIEHPPAPEWAVQNLRMPAGFFAEPGPFELTSRPYWREPLACIDDPEIEQISIMGDAQRGKTVLLIAMLITSSFTDPSPAMLAGPDQDAMRELRDRVYAMCQASPAVAPRIPPQRLWNDRYLDLETMYVYLAYSGSLQRLRGRTCKRVFGTEVDVWQDSPRLGKSAELIRARVKAFPEHLIVFESTPTDEASVIDAEYRRSDQRKFHVPCPKCNRFQELRFFPYTSGEHAGRGGVSGLRDSKGNWLTPDEAREAAYYLCEHGCKITSDKKPAMIAEGRWVPRGQHVAENGKLAGKRARSKRHTGFHLSALYDEKETFGEIAAEYIAAKEGNSLRVFFNNWLGLKFTSGSTLPKWKTLGRRLAWSHSRGTVPAEAWFLTASADVQADRVYWIVRAWGDRGTSWLVDWGICDKSVAVPERWTGLVAPDLAQLVPQVLDVWWPVEGGAQNPCGLTKLRVRVLGVDAGHRQTDVHAFWRLNPDGRVRAVHGDHKVDPTIGFRRSVWEKNARTGEKYEGGFEVWGIFVNAYKHDLVNRFTNVEVSQPGAFRLTRGILDEGEDYLRQIVNEGPVTVVKPSGRQVVEWQTRDKGLGEHYWDCEVYGRCLADMVTGGEWDAVKWPRPKRTDQEQARELPATPVTARDFSDDLSARE